MWWGLSTPLHVHVLPFSVHLLRRFLFPQGTAFGPVARVNSLGLVSVLHLSVLMPLLQRAGGWYWLHCVVILRVIVNLQLGLGFSKCWHFHVIFRNQHFGFSKGSIGISIWAS